MRFLLNPSYSTFAAYAFEVLFFALFAGLIVYVFSKKRTETYQHLQRLPLEDECSEKR